MGFLYFFGQYYYILIILQAICVYHCIRKGNQQNWIWLIVFLPAIGCIIYLFSEIITKKEVSVVQSNIDTIIRPTGRIKDLKRRLEFSDTFDNRTALADAYLEAGMYDDAIALYESCLSGIFESNVHVITQLIEAYSATARYADVETMAQRVLSATDFQKSHAHVLYALALEQNGKPELAEKELASLRGRYSNYEARVTYGQFLVRAGRPDEAKTIFDELLQEAAHMTSGESRHAREWFRKAREEAARLQKQPVG